MDFIAVNDTKSLVTNADNHVQLFRGSSYFLDYVKERLARRDNKFVAVLDFNIDEMSGSMVIEEIVKFCREKNVDAPEYFAFAASSGIFNGFLVSIFLEQEEFKGSGYVETVESGELKYVLHHDKINNDLVVALQSQEDPFTHNSAMVIKVAPNITNYKGIKSEN